jgi:hypothetical protein
MIVHGYNSSYAGGRDGRITEAIPGKKSEGTPYACILQLIYVKNNNSKTKGKS